MLSWNIAAIVGVPGVGKTSLCHVVAREIGCEHLNYGDLMLEIAREKNIAHSKTEMFAQDMTVQYHIWKAAANEITQHQQVLVDLHGLDQSPEGYIISMPLEIISPDLIVILDSSPEKIFHRRQKDRSKERIKDDFKSLVSHQKMLKISMTICSVFSGSLVYHLENNDFDSSKRNLIDLLS
ncbi:MAG: AAA family ATPase [Euryarchaeota archaeon]|nr:AAA family ATPase [Euryarchaeota archaeon]MBU4607908.1 AAA family ATPase [Euryarchaeota archaeon]MBV1754420.1 AAA family ATPase [Methanobacterium sp.]MBV1766701.1 AAA family ATPase [Methanobacterium sp.]